MVAFGDSITYGDGADRGRSYPDFLGRRLGGRAEVVNAGIPANRLLRDGGQDGTPAEAGPRALARLDDDVLGRPGVSDAIVLEGINDLSLTGASAGEVIGALREVGQRLEAADVDVLLGTLTPTGSAPGWDSPRLDAARRRVNAWIRRQPGVVDFDAAVRDPGDPSRLRAELDSGDGVHPSAAGYRAMAEVVPVQQLAEEGECGG